MTPSPETIALARELYRDGVPVTRILVQTRMTVRALYYWIDGGPPSGEGHLPPLPRRTARHKLPQEADRQSFIARLWRAAEKQVRDIERRLGEAGQEAGDRERDARTLAVLVRTLRELAAFDEAAPQQPAVTEDDDPVPTDIDEFRRELARRIDALVASRTDGADAGKPSAALDQRT
jgi:hypothetical protein